MTAVHLSWVTTTAEPPPPGRVTYSRWTGLVAADPAASAAPAADEDDRGPVVRLDASRLRGPVAVSYAACRADGSVDDSKPEVSDWALWVARALEDLTRGEASMAAYWLEELLAYERWNRTGRGGR